MDTRDQIQTKGREHRGGEDRPARIRWSRGLLGAALVCFALPFLTVTCYSDDVTVSGVQAATTIDLTPSPTQSDELAHEGEPPNLFAIVALVATAIGLGLTFGSATSRQTAVWMAASAAIALEGLYVYASYRTWAEALPDIGLPVTIGLLVAAAWAGVERTPRWVQGAIGVVAAATVPYSLLSVEDQMSVAQPFLAFIGGGIVAVCLAIGAIRASVRPESLGTEGARPANLFRMAVAGTVGLAFLAAAGVASVVLFGAMISNENGPSSIGSSGAFAVVVLGGLTAVSVLAWTLGGRIVHGPRKRPVGAPVTGAYGAVAH